MTKLSSARRMRDVYSCIIADTKKRSISTTIRHEKSVQPTEESYRPIKMAYSSFESKDLLSNSPVIIMHGLLGSKQNWNSLSKKIQERTKRKIITVDARNHGDSPHSSEMSYYHMVEDVRLLMTDLKLPKATVVGHSMGGRVMMLFALKYHAMVEQLVVVDISPVRTSPNMDTMPTYFDALRKVKLEPNQSLTKARKQADGQLAEFVKDSSVRQFMLLNLVEKEDGSFRWKMNLEALATHFNEIATFPPVNTSFHGPTSFIAGRLSDFVKPEDHEGIKRLLPNAAFSYIEGAGHMLHVEKPNEFLEVLCNFIIQGK